MVGTSNQSIPNMAIDLSLDKHSMLVKASQIEPVPCALFLLWAPQNIRANLGTLYV